MKPNSTRERETWGLASRRRQFKHAQKRKHSWVRWRVYNKLQFVTMYRCVFKRFKHTVECVEGCRMNCSLLQSIDVCPNALNRHRGDSKWRISFLSFCHSHFLSIFLPAFIFRDSFLFFLSFCLRLYSGTAFFCPNFFSFFLFSLFHETQRSDLRLETPQFVMDHLHLLVCLLLWGGYNW